MNRTFILALASLCWASFAVADDGALIAEPVDANRLDLLSADRVVFLGASNFHASEWLVQMEAAMRRHHGHVPELINLGLPSETCSGLSEPAHPFPRPCVLTRIDDALAKTKPDIVVACYGINDAIYHPFDEARFAAYQAGIEAIIAKVHAAGAKLALVTPPPFDRLPYEKSGHLAVKNASEFSWKTIYENYDAEVLAKYADHIRSLDSKVDSVVDVYTPMTSALASVRSNDPDAVLTSDGIHFNPAGHRAFANAMLSGLGFDHDADAPDEMVAVVRKRQAIMHLAWLAHVGHNRPGIPPGLPIDEARSETRSLDEQIRKFTSVP